jgi:hypothetical protein
MSFLLLFLPCALYLEPLAVRFGLPKAGSFEPGFFNADESLAASANFAKLTNGDGPKAT